jgi:hypothetical protein
VQQVLRLCISAKGTRNFLDILVSVTVPFFSMCVWVPCHHSMARPQVADGGDGLEIWRVTANILNKQ